MKLYAFSLLDVKTGIYHAPMFFPHPGLAVRAALDLGNDLSTVVGRHPYDYRLYRIGSFDDSIGAFDNGDPQDFGAIGSILAANVNAGETVDPRTATAAEIVGARANGAL